MSHTTYAAPRSISRRGFLTSTAAAGAALALPQGAFAQTEGQLLLWLPGGSDLFCKIHTGLLEGFSAGAGLGPATTVCGLGQDTEFTQALIGSITAGAPPDISMLWDSPVSLGRAGGLHAAGRDDERLQDRHFDLACGLAVVVPVQGRDLWPAGHGGGLCHVVQRGIVRGQGHPLGPRLVPQDLGRDAQAEQGVHRLGRR